jgi:hypothetical protein
MNIVYGEYLDAPGYICAWEITKPTRLITGSVILVQSHKDNNIRALASVKGEVSDIDEREIIDYGGRLPLPKVISVLKTPILKKQSYKFLD